MSRPLVIVLLAALAACKGKEEAPAPPPTRAPALPAAEVTRARAACDDLVARLCACAAAQPSRADLAEKCQMKKAKPEALQLALEVTEDPRSSDDTVARARVQAQRIVAKCFEEIAELPSLGCTAAPPPPGAAAPAPTAAPGTAAPAAPPPSAAPSPTVERGPATP